MKRTEPVSVQQLEGRVLLTTLAQSNYAREVQVRHLFDAYVSFLQTIELHSQATTAEYVALRDDTLSISQAASSTSLSLTAANVKADAVSVQIDRAFLDGFLDDDGWNEIESRMEANLDGLNVSQSVVDQTITDMKAAAQSVGLTADAYADLAAKDASLRQAEVTLPSGYGHFDDPQLYYTQHLRGFIRGGTVAKNDARNTLNSDVKTIGNAAVVRRDVTLLEQLGSKISSSVFADVSTAYSAAYSSSEGLAQLPAALQQAVGTTTRATSNTINKLVADAPAFFQAAGSLTNVETILRDVSAYVAAGGSAPLNPFRVQVVR